MEPQRVQWYCFSSKPQIGSTHGIQYDLLLAINNILVNLVGLHALDDLDVELLDCLLHLLGNLGGDSTRLEQPNSSLSSNVGCLDSVCCHSSNRLGRGSTDDNGLSRNSWVAVNVGTKLDLDNVVSLEGLGIRLGGGERGVVADDTGRRMYGCWQIR